MIGHVVINIIIVLQIKKGIFILQLKIIYITTCILMSSASRPKYTPISMNQLPSRYKEPSAVEWPSKVYKIMVHSKQQETSILASLAWRQTTSMPVVKVLDLKMESVVQQQFPYAQLITVQIQPILKDIHDLSSIELSEAVYLIREFLLGIQTISIKLNYEFDLKKGFYCLNDKGQAKVWLSQNLIQGSNKLNSITMSFSTQKVYHIIDYLFQMVGQCVKPTYKATLQQIGQKFANQYNITFAQAHTKLRKYCNQLNITLSNTISLISNQKRSVHNTDKKQQQKSQKKMLINKQQAMKIGQKHSFVFGLPSKGRIVRYTSMNQQINNKLNSPPRQSIITKNQISVSKNDHHSKPKVTWSYANSANNRYQKQLGGYHNQGSSHTVFLFRKSSQSFYQNSNPRQAHNMSFKFESAANSINRTHCNPAFNNISNTAQRQRESYFCRSVPIKIEDQRLNSQNMRNMLKEAEKEREIIEINQFNPLQEQQQHLQSSQVKQINQISIFNEACNMNIGQSNADTQLTKNNNQVQSKISFNESNVDSFIIENELSHTKMLERNNKKSQTTTYTSNHTNIGASINISTKLGASLNNKESFHFMSSGLLHTSSQDNKSRNQIVQNNVSECQEDDQKIQQFKQKCNPLAANSIRLDEMINNRKSIFNSIMISNAHSNLHAPAQGSRAYNFGGLIKISGATQLNNESEQLQIQGKEAQSLNASRQEQISCRQKHESIIFQSKIIERVEQKLNADTFPKGSKVSLGMGMGMGMNIRTMSKFFSNKCKQLKQSLWYGEEKDKRADHLHIKLQKLGHFGREIKESYIPQ